MQHAEHLSVDLTKCFEFLLCVDLGTGFCTLHNRVYVTVGQCIFLYAIQHSKLQYSISMSWLFLE